MKVGRSLIVFIFQVFTDDGILHLRIEEHKYSVIGKHLGRVVGKLVNVNPGLSVIYSIIFSWFKNVFTSNVCCSLILLQLKTERQTT